MSKAKRKYRKKTAYTFHCRECGQQFVCRRSTAEHCSPKCKQRTCRYVKKHGQYPQRHPNTRGDRRSSIGTLGGLSM